MSHITTLRTSVDFKNERLLKEALKGLATVNEFQNGFNATVKQNEKAFMVTFIKQSNKFVVKADTWQVQNEVNAFMNQVEGRYKMSAVQEILRKQHYSIAKKTDTLLVARRY